MRKIYLMAAFLLAVCSVKSQDSLAVVRVNEQRSFPKDIPAGNYSGITYIGDSVYAVVSDKSQQDGFFLFKIALDSITGDVLHVENLGFRGDTDKNGDMEAVTYVPSSKTLYVTRETDNTIKEYAMDGHLMRRLPSVPAVYQRDRGNYGLLSLSFNELTQTFWTCNEGTLLGDGEQATATNGVRNRLRLQSFSADFQPLHQYAYLMDAPEANRKAYLYGMGVAEVTALDDGCVLVLEREFYTPPSKLGAFVNNKLFLVHPQEGVPIDGADSLNAAMPYLKKRLVTKWTTHLSLFHHDIANFEGMCLGPKLSDGSRVLVLVSDSQNQAGGVMKDWFKTIVLSLPKP